ncbi:WcbI family polysaccharide biosynthesis putative acetyltransferase [Methylobacterium planeticum]|nr:WcbI family polysaccharide biosynthesis putative acetyltransferase [Methylobacterium planeticum]
MRIYGHGNCQASAVGWLLREVRPEWQIKSREVQTFDLSSDEELEQYHVDIEEADIILAQPISDGYRGVDTLSLSQIQARKRPDTGLFIFPSMHFRGYNIESFAIGVEGYGLGYDDVHVADMYASGVSVDECYDRISSPTFFTRAFVLYEVMVCLRELIRRETACGAHARVSSILADKLDQELLFHTFNHPARKSLVGVTEQLMSAAGVPVTIPVGGMSYLSNIRIMPYPSTVIHLGLDPTALPELGQRVQMHVAMSTFDFVKSAYEQYGNAGRDAVRAALSQHPQASWYQARFEGSKPLHCEAFDAASFVESLFHTLLKRHPTSPEVQYWVKMLPSIGPAEVVRRFTASAEFQDYHSRVAVGAP